MVSLRREGAWASSRRLRLPLERVARLATPVLVVAAALFGAAVSAVVLVGFWGAEATGRHAAETKLAAATHRVTALTATNERLAGRLAAARAASARLARSEARLRATAQSLLRESTALVATARSLRDRGGVLEQRAASVSKLAGTLGSDLVAVLGYVTSTSAGSLDPSYLKAQLDYLRPALASVRSAADALGGDAGAYAQAIDRFAAQASAYEAALTRLAAGRPPPSGR